MKRTCLLSTVAVLATLATSSTASADDKPAILYIPNADVELTPSGAVDTHCAKVSLSADVAAAGCLGNLDEATTRSPNGRIDDIVAGVTAALEPYDVHVVTEAPPPYVPVYAILTTDEMSEESVSHTCGGAALTCASRGRDSIAFTNTGTTNCSDPDLVQSALYTFGRLAGLEGKTDMTDAMAYPPDYSMATATFVDECGDIAQLLGGDKGDMELPLECTSADHSCEAGQQNSHQDLLDYFGAATPDTEAPTISTESYAEGDVVPAGTPLNVEAIVADDSGFAAVSITIASEALDGVVAGGALTFCTTDICDQNFLEGEPFKTADSGWGTGDISMLPGGDYTITLEAADYAGNVAETVAIKITLEGGGGSGGDTDGGETDGGSASGTGMTTDDTNGSGFVTDGDDGSSGGSDTDGSGSGAADDGGSSSGCSVGANGSGGSFALMLGLFGLGFLRRRK